MPVFTPIFRFLGKQFTSDPEWIRNEKSMKSLKKLPCVISGVQVLAILLLPGTVLATERYGNPSPALPPHSFVYGKTLQEWSALWWKWIWSFPVNDNPDRDLDPNKTGDKTKFGDVGPVFFLGGWLGEPPSGPISRTVKIPANKYIFFGIETASNENVARGCTDPGKKCAKRVTIDELYAELDPLIRSYVTSLHASIDGIPVPNLWQHREISPVFSYVLQLTDNLYEIVNGVTTPDAIGTIFPVVADGYYLMLRPLSIGRHTINFGGTLNGSSIDVTYEVTVTPNASFTPTVLVP